MLKKFSVPAAQDSVRAAINTCQQAGIVRVTITREFEGGSRPIYLLRQDGKTVGRLLGKEMVCGGHHFAFVPEFDPDQELRLESLQPLIWDLSLGRKTRVVVEQIMFGDDLFDDL